MFGRGTQRGGAVTVSGQTLGWTWGTSDQVQRWGQNNVDGVTAGGAALGISTRTVETHRDSLMRKIGIRTVAGLTRLALEQGLIG